MNIVNIALLYEESPKEKCGYAYLRFEHECSTTLCYRRRAVACSLAPARLALKLFFVAMAELEEHIRGVETENKLYGRLDIAWHQAIKIQSWLKETEDLPPTLDTHSIAAMSRMDKSLSWINVQMVDILPSKRPTYREDWLTVLTKIGSA